MKIRTITTSRSRNPGHKVVENGFDFKSGLVGYLANLKMLRPGDICSNYETCKEIAMKIKATIALVIATLLLPATMLFAADKDQDRDRIQDQDKDQQQLQDRDRDQTQLKDNEMIYGYDLMTVEERAQHREKMRSLNTAAEREAYQQEHHKLMQARARERGVMIPEIPAQRGGVGPGGAGSGGGAGKGR